jgi:hypothetical protein
MVVLRSGAYHESDRRLPRRTRPNVFARITRLAAHRQLLVIVIWAVMASAGLAYALVAVEVDLRASSLLPGAQEGRTAQRIALVLRSADRRAARQAAASLAADLRAEPRLFREVAAPGTGDFLDQYGALYLDEASLGEMVSRIERSAPLYRAIAASPDLGGLATLALEASRAIAAGRSPQGLNLLFEEGARTVRAAVEGKPRALDWPSLIQAGNELPAFNWVVLAEAASDSAGAMVRAQQLAAGVSDRFEADADLVVPPSPHRAARPDIIRPLLIPALVAGLLLVAVLSLGLARTGLISAFLAVAALGFAACIGAGVLISPRLDRVTVSAPLFFLAFAFPAALGLLLRTEEHERSGATRESALMVAAHRLGPGLIAALVAIPLGAAAAALLGSEQLASLAQWLAVAAATVLLASLTLLPALLSFDRAGARTPTHWLDRILAGPAAPTWRKFRQAISASLIAVAVFFSALLPQIAIDDKNRAAAPVPAEDHGPVISILGVTTPLTAPLRLTADPGEPARRLAARLGALPEVASVRWVESFLPPDETGKRQILARLESLLPHAPERSPDMSEDRLSNDLARLEQGLLEIANNPKTEAELKSAASEFRRSLALFDDPRLATPQAVAGLQTAFFERFAELLARVERLANLPPVSPASLDPDIARRFVAGDGSWVIEVAPRAGVGSNAFTAAVAAVSPDMTGAPKLDDTIFRASLGYGLAGTFLLAFVGAVVAARSGLAGIRVCVPPAVALVIAAGGLVLFGISLRPEHMALVLANVALVLMAAILGQRWDTHPGRGREPPSLFPRTMLLAQVLLAILLVPTILSDEPALRDFGRMALVCAAAQLVTVLFLLPQFARWFR